MNINSVELPENDLTKSEQIFLKRIYLRLQEMGATPENFNTEMMMEAAKYVVERDEKITKLILSNPAARDEMGKMVYHACRNEL